MQTTSGTAQDRSASQVVQLGGLKLQDSDLRHWQGGKPQKNRGARGKVACLYDKELSQGDPWP